MATEILPIPEEYLQEFVTMLQWAVGEYHSQGIVLSKDLETRILYWAKEEQDYLDGLAEDAEDDE